MEVKMYNGKRVFLVINTGYFGDTLLTSKLTSDIKKEYPDSFLLFLVDAPYLDVAKGLPGVDEVIIYNRKQHRKFIPFIKFIMKFPYKNKIDVAFVAQRKKTSRNILAKILGSKRVFCFATFSDSNTCNEFKAKNHLNKRFAHQLANLLSYLTGKETDNQDIKYFVPKLAQEKIDKYLKSLNLQNNLVAINPQASSDWKCWDVNEVVKLVKLLIKDGKKVILTGVLKDGPQYVYALDSQIGAGNYLNMVDETNIPELAALYKRCEAVVSVDTGSMHMACAVGTPTIAIFFREDYELWGPLNNKKNPYIYSPGGLSAEIVHDKILEYSKNLSKLYSN